MAGICAGFSWTGGPPARELQCDRATRRAHAASMRVGTGGPAVRRHRPSAQFHKIEGLISIACPKLGRGRLT